MPQSAKQIRRDANRLFRWCLVDANLDEDRARRAIREVVASHRRGYISLLAQFRRLLKLEDARHTATVESAVPLTADLQARARQNLRAAYGPVATTFSQNSDLIAGVRIQVGWDVYDGSVRSKLALLERSLGVEPIRKHAKAS